VDFQWLTTLIGQWDLVGRARGENPGSSSATSTQQHDGHPKRNRVAKLTVESVENFPGASFKF
jgi:hypothetical protein